MKAAANLSSHRAGIAARVLARAVSPLVAHDWQRIIVEDQGGSIELRSLALAIMRVELIARPLSARVLEYVAMPLAAALGYSVTVGPAQMKVHRLKQADDRCDCGCDTRTCTSFWKITNARHYLYRFTSHVHAMMNVLQDPRMVANAYQKGIDANDLHLPTVYSEVVVSLIPHYRQVLLGTSNEACCRRADSAARCARLM